MDSPLKAYSIQTLETIYEWAAREKKRASMLDDADAQKRYWKLFDIQVATHEELKLRGE